MQRFSNQFSNQNIRPLLLTSLKVLKPLHKIKYRVSCPPELSRGYHPALSYYHSGEFRMAGEREQQDHLKQYLCTARKRNETNMSNPIANYIWQNSQREPDILRRLHEKTAVECEKYRMISDPLECQLLRMMLRLMNAKKAIEIGVFTGYNLLSVALTLPKDGKIVACDISSNYVDIGKPFLKEAGVLDKIDFRIQPAVKTLDELIAAGESGSYDFIYIDADKMNMVTYYEKGLQLLRSGGLIAVDNALWSGKVTLEEQDEATKVIHSLNQMIHKDDRVSNSLLPIGDGVNLAQKI